MSKKMYRNANDYLLHQRALILNNIRKKEFQSEESELSHCIVTMKREMLSRGNVKKRFRDCVKVTNMIEHSYTVSNVMKKAAMSRHELYSYKISGTLDAIDMLFVKMQTLQSGFFCKTIVLTKQSDNMYIVSLVFKEYGEEKK